jgi:hypothetical protein
MTPVLPRSRVIVVPFDAADADMLEIDCANHVGSEGLLRIDAARFVLKQQSRLVERYDAFGDLRFEPAFDAHLIA